MGHVEVGILGRLAQENSLSSFDSTLAYVNPSDGDASAAAAKAFSVDFYRIVVRFCARSVR
jgi:hypothetical protein